METTLLFIFGIVIFIVGLVLSVALHELGHLTFAKIFGVKVSQYMVGFGRTLWSFRRGETEYGVKPILLGGYISMAGMFPPSKAKDDGEPDPETGELRRNIFSALVQDAREASATTIGTTDPSRAFYNAAPWKRIIIMFAGPFMNLVIAAVIGAILICGFGAETPSIGEVSTCVPATATATCAPGDATSPAKASGLRAGDVLLTVNGRDNLTINQATAMLQHSMGKAVQLGILRNGVHKTLSVTPTPALRGELDAQGNPVTDKSGRAVTGQVGSIGVSIGASLVRQSPAAILPFVWQETTQTVGLIGSLPSGLAGVWQSTFDGGQRSLSGPISIVGVGRAVGTVASVTGAPVSDRIYVILGLLGSLNIALFVMNLLPLLPLDGGHILGALWEIVKRQIARLRRRPRPAPVDLARAMPFTVVVVSVLVVVSAFLIFADLVNPVQLT